MDSFDKRTIFYIILIFGIAIFFIIPYSDGIYHWNDIYEEAQENMENSIQELSYIKDFTKYKWDYYYFFSWEITDTSIHKMSGRLHYGRYLAGFEFDSLWIPLMSGYDTILIIKNYTNYSDTIKIALEDL